MITDNRVAALKILLDHMDTTKFLGETLQKIKPIDMLNPELLEHIHKLGVQIEESGRNCKELLAML